MFDKVKEWLASAKVWLTAIVALIAEWALGIIDAIKGLVV